MVFFGIDAAVSRENRQVQLSSPKFSPELDCMPTGEFLLDNPQTLKLSSLYLFPKSVSHPV